jgi:hypothetical protein
MRERVAGDGLLDADQRHDVAGDHGVELRAIRGVHAEDAAHALALALGRVPDLIALEAVPE